MYYICTIGNVEEAIMSPRFFLDTIHMIDKQTVYDIVAEALQESDCFIVDVMVRPGNSIIVEIDNKEGIDIERCETLHRHIESKLDREVEDYELEVGSAGITSPFKVVAQYQKNIGNEVEVLSCDGRKLSGILKECNDHTFTLTITKKVKPEGSKRKIEVEENLQFAYNEVKYTKYLIRFK